MPTTERRVALLRGINVGKAKRIAMADLRALFEDLGYRDVRTLLNSGNVVFTAGKKAAAGEAARIEHAIAGRHGVTTSVMLVTAKELVRAVEDNPLRDCASEPSRFLILVLRDAQAAARLDTLVARRWSPEALAVRGRIAYLWCAAGIADGLLWKAVNRAIGDGGTARNLTTVTKLLALAVQA